jgi:hypothetical protein
MEVDNLQGKDIGFLHDEYDYKTEKLKIREMFELWRQNEEESQRSIELLGKFKGETSSTAASLCEQLRIVLEP